MNKQLAAVLLALTLPTMACGSVESPDDDMQQDPDMMEPTPDDPEMPTPTPKPQPGTVDTLYGSNGYLKLDGVLGYPNDMGVQGDKLVVCSTATIEGKLHAVLTRVGFDGTVDENFGVEFGRIIWGDNSFCSGVLVRPDNRIVIFVRTTGGTAGLFRYDANGQQFDSISAATFKTMNIVPDGNMLLAAGTTAAGGFASRDAENQADFAQTPALTGSLTKPFLINGKHAIAGVYGTTGWSLLVEQADGSLPMPSKSISVGNPMTADLMHDAALLPDGSVLAVGSADSEVHAMVARMSSTGADPNYAVRDGIGLTSTFRDILVDGQDHALLFGTSTTQEGSKIMWQRIDTTTLSADPDYANGGTVVLPAYQGSGDISKAVAYNGAVYALTAYNVEAVSGAALLKINK